jgi:hypothetical protein
LCKPNFNDPYFKACTRSWAFYPPFRAHEVRKDLAVQEGGVINGKIKGNYLESVSGSSVTARFASDSTGIEGRNTGAINICFRKPVEGTWSVPFFLGKSTDSGDYVTLYIPGTASLTGLADNESLYWVHRRGGQTRLSWVLDEGLGLFADGKWHSICVVVDGVNNRFIIDGTVYDNSNSTYVFGIGSNTTSEFTNIHNNDTAQFGSRTISSSTISTNIDIREVTFFTSGALSDDEIIIRHQLDMYSMCEPA